ncbi:MAG: transglutaminase domain-containing protein [Hyphomicrobium sp.]
MRQAFDEMNGNGGQGVRSPYSAFAEWLGTQKLEALKRKSVEAETLFRRTGITFSVYGNEDAGERLIPFDIIPRILSASEWRRLTVGIEQRVRARDPIDRMHVLMNAVRDKVDYAIGVTNAHTSAAEALSDGQGVCQDHAHIFISAARVMGVPARYVNGYFLTETDEPSEAHHAWAEAYIEGLGWLGFDPANGICPTDHYVRLACGLDAGSAAPIRGTRRGGTDEVLDVLVEVQQQSAQQ